MAQYLICSTCGHVGRPEYAKKGTVLISIVLWLTFIIPGIIYTLWRLNSRHKKCGVCGSTTLIPLDTPAGKKLLADQGKTMQQAIAEAPVPPGPTQVPVWLGWVIAGVVIVGFFTLFMTYA